MVIIEVGKEVMKEIDGAAPQSLEEIVGEVSKSVGWRNRKEQ
jgi:hypothetical protein